MTNRQERLTEVYDHLREHHGIHTQTGFATALGYSRPVISSALNGNELSLTDKLFQKVCEVYPEFNLEYLLTGKGSLLIQKPTSEQGISPANEMENVLELYARMIRGVDDLRVRIKDELTDIQSMKDEMRQACVEFHAATTRLERIARQLSSSDRPMDFAAEDSDY